MSTESTPTHVNPKMDEADATAPTTAPGTNIPVLDVTPEASQRQGRMLYRHPSQRMVGGVCAGLADSFGFDPALVRIIWAAATVFTGGGGVLAYAALWLLLPVGTAAEGQKESATFELNERNLGRVALLLIGLGGLWLLANLGVLPWLLGSVGVLIRIFFWPALLIGAGYMLLRSARRENLGQEMRDGMANLRTRFTVKTPDREQVKDGLKKAQGRIPLKRPLDDRMFLGVCGGIGQTLSIDANLVRLIWAAFSVGSLGAGVLLYVLLGLLLPEQEITHVAPYTETGQNSRVVDSTATTA